MPFANTVAQLDQLNINNIKVIEEDYDRWLTQVVVFDKLKDLRYGQSFCNHFGITDPTLYYFTADKLADEWIKKNYIRKNNGNSIQT
jgi:hypothetical protein